MPASEPRTTVQQLFDMSGKVSLVTGARGLLGRAFAEALAEAGSRVVVSSRDADSARDFARSLPHPGGAEHVGVAIDYLDPNSIESGFAQAIELAGPIQILINNGYHRLMNDWRSVTAEEFNQQMSLATGYFLLARTLRDHAVDRSLPASIVMLGSMYGLVGSYPAAYEGVCEASPVAYHALKGGVVQLTRHLAVYWAPDRVRVNCLSPGPFPGPQASPVMVERLTEHSPMGRMGRPDELKGALVFLASDASSYMTGHNLVVDGGWTAW